jgi:hypothetical protein
VAAKAGCRIMFLLIVCKVKKSVAIAFRSRSIVVLAPDLEKERHTLQKLNLAAKLPKMYLKKVPQRPGSML